MPKRPALPALKALRLRRKVVLRQIADKAKCTKSAVLRWDRGITEPAAAYRKAYAESLGISVGELGRIVYEESVR
jgi:transcriptional regulator with XRE-family HTH domain